VRWEQCLARLFELGVTDFVEVGPGTVLANMLKRSTPAARVHGAGALDSIQAAIAALQG